MAPRKKTASKPKKTVNAPPPPAVDSLDTQLDSQLGECPPSAMPAHGLDNPKTPSLGEVEDEPQVVEPSQSYNSQFYHHVPANEEPHPSSSSSQPSVVEEELEPQPLDKIIDQIQYPIVHVVANYVPVPVVLEVPNDPIVEPSSPVDLLGEALPMTQEFAEDVAQHMSPRPIAPPSPIQAPTEPVAAPVEAPSKPAVVAAPKRLTEDDLLKPILAAVREVFGLPKTKKRTPIAADSASKRIKV